MSLLAPPLPNDTVSVTEPAATSDSLPAAAGNAAGRQLESRKFAGRVLRVVLVQLLFGLLSISVLTVGLLTDFGTSWHPDIAWFGVTASLGISAGLLLSGVLLSRYLLRSFARIERQLRYLAVSELISVEDVGPVAGGTALESGWNRLVDSVRSSGQASSLNDRLEAAVLEYRNQRGEQILNVLTDGIAVTDNDQRITSANNALSSILQMDGTSESLQHESIEKCLVRKTGQELCGDLHDSRYRGRRVVTEIACSEDESACILRVCRTPLGGGSGFVWSIRDITQQKMADKMRDQFVNAATHELRTPMANIKAYAETLASGDVEDIEQQKTFCTIINDEVTRLARFIDDLLHLNRMEVGATTLQLQVTEMKRFFEEIAEKVRPQMARKDIHFTVELPAKLPELTVDKDKLTVAMINLLGNGAKYTPNGGCVRLHVGLAEESIEIDVEDTGIGIKEAELPKVLEKFYRSSDPRVHGETGSGLGLSLTNEIIRLHGGTLSISSELDKGSKFTFTLPYAAG